jgi:hypothetical protein
MGGIRPKGHAEKIEDGLLMNDIKGTSAAWQGGIGLAPPRASEIKRHDRKQVFFGESHGGRFWKKKK